MRRAGLAAALAAPLLCFALIPLAVLLFRGVARTSLVQVAIEERRTLLNTVVISSGAALFSLLVGGLLALLLYRTDLPGRRVFAALFALPSAIPAFIWGMGWLTLAGPKAGLLNRALGIGLDVQSRAGIVFVMGTVGIPLVMLAGASAFRRVDPALEEAARVCGAGPVRALLASTLPLAWPSLVSGAVLVFLLTASAFAVPYMLGVAATPPTLVATTRIYAQLLMGSASLPPAWALSAVLMGLTPFALGANALLGRSARVRLGAGKGLSPKPFALGRARWPAFGATVGIAAAVVALPLGAIALVSVQPHFGAPISAGALTVGHWKAVLTASRTLGAAARSLSLAVAAGLVIVALGATLALAKRSLGRVGAALGAAAIVPYAVPGTVLAMALLVAFSRDLRFVFADRIALVLALANTPWILLVAYTGKYLALGQSNASEAVAQLDPSLEEAARLSGAGRWRTLADVTLPLLRPALSTAFWLAFLFCATEITMSVLLVAPGSDLLGSLLFELQSYADPSSAAVLACALVVLALCAQGALAFSQRGEGRA
jgi:iron(III) transport system permease protein